MRLSTIPLAELPAEFSLVCNSWSFNIIRHWPRIHQNCVWSSHLTLKEKY